jgi:hypothetical protein
MRSSFSRCVGLAVCTLAAPSLVAAEPAAEEAVTPREVITLFNGKDLSGFYPYVIDKSGKEPKPDPKQVFRVDEGSIRIAGNPHGYLATEKAYRDYRLVVEYKWGAKPEGEKYVRNSGVLLHGTGPDGGNKGGWMTSIECQLAQGCTGDLIVIRGKDAEGKEYPATIASETVLGPDRRTRWKKGGEKTVYSGKQFWWSLHDPDFKELIDTRGKQDVESPLGEWTRLECICQGDRITIVVNGTTVNECFEARPASGKILLQGEGAEVLFRKVELHPLAKP